MPENVILRPARDGLVVRDPKTRLPLPPEGRELNKDDPYWIRRLADGDVVIGAPVAPDLLRVDTHRHETPEGEGE